MKVRTTDAILVANTRTYRKSATKVFWCVTARNRHVVSAFDFKHYAEETDVLGGVDDNHDATAASLTASVKQYTMCYMTQ